MTAPNTPTIASATDNVEAVTGTLTSGDSTNDATPTLTGSAEAGSTVTITHNGEVVGSETSDANGSWSYTPSTDLADGDHIFSVTATDEAGNESAASGEFTLTVDTTAPDAPILSETDGETANGSTVNGNAEAGGTVEITNGDGDLLGSGTVAEDGTFSITLSPKQEAGAELTATVTDAAGNESPVSDTLVVPEDADVTAPNAPTIASATDNVEAVTGTLASGDSTNDATPTLTGSAEAGSTVTITHNGEEIGTTTADSNGIWSFTPETDFADGDHVFSVTATDAAGNESAPSADFTLTVDTTAPDAPILSETDGETANGSTVNGSAEAGGTVEITNGDGDLLGSGTVADDGTFSITLSPKQEAGTELTATVTDAAGNESAVSDTLVVPEDADVTAPNAPTIASATDDVEADTGALADGDSTNDATPTLTGSAEIGSTVTLTHNGEEIGTATADSNGTWSFTPATGFTDGEHVFSVTATDAAGNESAPSADFTLTVDTVAPNAPVLAKTDGTTVAGTGEAGTTIEITNTAGDVLGSAEVDTDGNFSVELSPEQEAGSTLTATATDAAGNESATSAALDVPEDADVTAPNAPTIASATDDVAAVTGTLADGDSTNDATPTLTGSAEAGSTVTLTHNGEVIGTTIADSNGTWSFTPATAFADGEHVFSVTATDAAGNESAPSADFTLTVDTTAPDAPILSETDGITVAGTGEAGTTVEITNAAGDVLASAEVDTDGNFSVALSPEQDAGTELTATVTDAAGNESPASDTLVVPEDADVTAPNAPTIASATDNVEAVTGSLANGDSTNDATPTLTGSAEAGSTITLTHNGEEIGTTIADSNGTWSFTPATDFADGEHVFSVTATDAAGNESAPSADFTLTVDTTAPDAPVLAETDGTTVTGTGEAGTTVEITNAAGDVLGSAEVDIDGNFSVALSPEQDAGTELTATVTDAAGNESAVSDTLVVPEDADVTAPNAPTIASATDDVEAVTGTLADGDSTNDATPTLTGSAEAGSTVTITHNGEEIATVTADANGSWSYTPSTDLADGGHVFSVTATDTAGNESAASADFTLTVDTTAPDAPVLSETDGTTVAGTGEAGTTLEITNANDDVLGTAVVDADGTFSVELSPEQEAGIELTATVTDAAGNESAVSDTLVVPEDADVTAPNTPTIASATDNVEAVTGTLASGDSTNDATPTLTGSAEIGSTVTVTHNGEVIGTTTADANGTWSFTPETEFADGEHVISVTATDAAGNESAVSADFTLTVDTAAPDAPVLSETDGTTVAGTGEAGTTLEITNGNDDVVGTAVVDAEGNFSVELSPVQEAGAELTATVTDAAGNESPVSDTLVVPEDADVTAPNTPTIASATNNVEAVTGTLANGDSTNDATPTLTGSAEAGSTVTVTHNGEVIGTAIADTNGAWSFTPETELADGDHVFSVTATDEAGNESAASGEFTLTVDTTAPDAPILSETDGTIVAGTGEAGTTIEITNANDDVLGTAVVDADGTFSVELSPEQEAGSELTAIVTDATGNESAVSDTLVVPEDADVTAPNTPTIVSATDDVAAVTGSLANGDSTNDATPTLTGSAEAGSTVTITHNGEVVGSETADANASWSYTPSTDLADGDHVFSVTATDEAGNVSAPSGEFTLTVDTTAPTNPTLVLTNDTNTTDDGITSNGEVTVSDLETGATWEYTTNGGTTWTAGTGTTFTLAEGSYADGDVQIRQTDVAGNVSDAVNLGTVTVDATIAAPSLALTTDTNVADDGITSNGEVTISGLEANATWEYTTNGGTTWIDGTGTTFTLDEGVYADGAVQIRQTDVAGNVSTEVSLGAVIVDATIAAPSLALTTDTNVTDDGITSNGEVIVSGLEADATWEYSLDGGSNWIDGTGTTFTLDEGVYADGDVQIRQTDVAGNISDAVNLGDVTVDATAPTTTATIDAISDDSGTAGDFITNDDDGLTVTATLSAELATGEALLYSTDGTTWIDITDSVSGTAVSYADADLTASATVQLKVQDAAGNDGAVASQAVVIDAVAPTTTATIDAISDDSGTAGDFITNDDDGLTVTATLSAELATGEALLYSTDGTTWVDITDSVSGTAVSYNDADLTTSATVQLKVQDTAGNDGEVTSQAVVIDAVAPTTTATIDAISDDSGTAGDFITNDDDGLTVTATLSAELATGEALLYSTDGTTWVDITDSVSGTAVSYADADLTASATVQLKVQDAAGNDGDIESQDVVIDTIAPTTTATIDAISDDSGTAGDFITNDDDGLTVTATLSAELATGEALLYSTDGSTWVDITDSVSGTAVSYNDADLTASATVQLKVQDTAGNDGEVTSQAVVIDAVAPTTTVTIDAISDDSGTAGDFITNDDDGLTVTATLDAPLAEGETLQYSTDGTTWIDITDSVTGTAVSYADASLTTSATVQLKVQDAAGNDGAVVSQAVVIDAVAPTTTATIDAISDDSGTAGDFITNDDDGLTITATLSAELATGEALLYSTDGTTWIDITDSVSGTAVSYADADLTASATVQLKVQDAAGNDGAVASQAVVIDAVAPTTTATIDAISDDSGTAGDFITNDDDGLTVTATLSAELATGEALLYSTDGTTWVDITDSVSGTAVSYADADLTASATVQLKVQDAAGNDGAVASQAVVIDAVAPTTTATIDAISDDSGTAGDFITNDDDGLTITATLSAELATGEALLYSTDGTTWIDITDSVSGTAVSYADADLTASATVQLKVQDAAGNDGAVASQAVVIDAVAPTTTATIDAISDDSGTAGDFITNDDDGLTVTATLSAELATGKALLYSTDGTTWVDITDSVSGTAVSYADADLTASATVQLKVQDAAGNDGAVASQAVVIDAVAPTTTATIDAISDDSGTAGDFITNDDDGLTVTATLSAELATGEALLYSTDGTTWIDITDSVSGTAVSYADADLTASATVQLKVQDAAGNDGDIESQDVVIDTIAPTTTATIDAISDNSGTAGDFITNDDDGLTVTATLSAELATGEALLYSTDGSTWVDITDSVSGTAVSYNDADLTASATVQLKVQDTAGNDGAIESQNIVIDTTAPTGSVINFTDADGDALNAAEATDVTFEGTVEAGLTSSNLTIVITDTDNGSVSVTTENITVSAAGEVTVSGVDLTGLAEGLLTVTMTVTDDAGNENVAAVTDTATKLSDDFLDLGNANRLTISEALIASAAGAVASTQSFADTSGEATLSLSSTESLTSNGQALEWVVTDAGRTLTLASDADNAAATAVMVVSVTEDGSEVIYSAELLGNIDQVNAESSTVDVLVTLTDGASSTSSTLNIDIADDVPTIAASTVVETLSSNTDYTGSIFDGEDDFGFGADAAYGQVQSFTFKGLTFTVSDDGTYADVTGTSTEIGLEAGDTVSIVDGILAVETLSGESFSLNIDSGDYSYSHQGQFSATEEANTRPQANVTESDGVLGLVGVNVLDIVTLSNDQLYSVYDAEDNVSSVTLSTNGLISSLTGLVEGLTLGLIPVQAAINALLGTSSWVYSEALASELGLTVITDTNSDSEKTITISSSDGSDINNIEINELLASVDFTISSPGLLSGLLSLLDLDSLADSILSSTTIYATDSLGATSSDTDASLANVELLVDDYEIPVNEGTTGNDTVTASQSGSNLYGYAGNDTLNGGSGSNILRGGSGDDILNGAAGSDLLIGGSGDDSLDGGAGVDVIRWEAGDEGTVTTPATDTVLDFNNDSETDATSGDTLDLTDLLTGAYYVDSATNNLASYISAEYVSAAGATVLYINTEGGLTADPAASANQVINIDGLDLTEGGTLTSSEVIDSLISGEQLLVGTEVNESDVSVTVVDGDGDTATGEITFVGEESLDAVTNTAPIVTLQDSELLGLVGLEAIDLIDLSNNQVFVADPDNNLREVVINYAAVVDVSALSGLLTDPQFTWDNDLATSLGLSVTSSNGGIIGTLATSAELTITATDGGDIDNLALTQFLATIGFDDGGAAEFNLANIDLLDAYSITATDAYDASTTDAISSLAGVELLDSNEPLFSGIDESNTFIGSLLTDDEIDISANLEGSAIFGLSGNDSLIGGLGNDVIRGGEGDDSLVGNAGDDLLIGDSGSNTFDGGAGDDLIVTSSLDFTIEGGADIDTVRFDGTGKGIDLVALSAQAEPSVMTNIEVLDISASSETGTSLKIDADTVLNLTDGDNELYIDGDEGDSVEAAGATSSATTTEFNGTTYDTYQLGEATLYIDQDVTVNTSNG
ncbi:hypothetical protein F8A90_08445 [Cobetia sp. cqz5-12]|uniref:Ig-like domain-containing protein n=1 Tax=Cobetia sp. cqz5-12 TaxID=2609415 RepID=UPI001904E873|nr:Ig-like domain-containing protein [Cobetia sp. cqz5-12]QQK64147.1 hypothetical protein F8A90_08445 [Cobetia sp. cqz5-12]